MAIIRPMSRSTKNSRGAVRWRYSLIQRRISPEVDHLRPQRWNWTLLVRPLDHSLAQQAQQPLPSRGLRSLRNFWLDGLFAAVSENFYLGYVALFALAYGANNSQVGALVAAANLLGMLSLFPGARLIERTGRRKQVVTWSAGVFGRLALLCLAMIPFLFSQPAVAIVAIIAVDSLRSFLANLANPGWTSLVADLVPEAMRGRFFASRNMAIGIAALLVAPFAGRIISATNSRLDSLFAGYQAVFLLAFIFGLVSTVFFSRIQEPHLAKSDRWKHHAGDLRRVLKSSPGFVGLIISAFVWNMALQVAAPFFNVYLVNAFGATALTIGILAGISSLTALVGQPVFGRLLDKKGAFWVQATTGLLIPLLPLAWAFISAPWQVGIINSFSGFLWAGYNLASFSLLIMLTPDQQRPRAVAMYHTAVLGSAVVGPLFGGYLADTVGFKSVFVLSSAGRLLGTGLFLWLTMRPRKVLEVTS
jgi:MFS family permease